jgi:hypothetical protein
MKTSNRLAILLWTISLSALVIAVIRANPQKLEGYDQLLEPHESRLQNEGIWAPQKVWFQLSIEGSRINLYILDQSGVQQWQEQETLKPVISFENITQLSYRFTVPTRSEYAVLIINPNNSTTTANLAITFYDFETDLLIMATALFIIGIVILPTHRFKQVWVERNSAKKAT